MTMTAGTYRAPVTDAERWYATTMCSDLPGIPVGVHVDPDDLRAVESCKCCDELVDAWGGPFTATSCARCLSGGHGGD